MPPISPPWILSIRAMMHLPWSQLSHKTASPLFIHFQINQSTANQVHHDPDLVESVSMNHLYPVCIYLDSFWFTHFNENQSPINQLCLNPKLVNACYINQAIINQLQIDPKLVGSVFVNQLYPLCIYLDSFGFIHFKRKSINSQNTRQSHIS